MGNCILGLIWVHRIIIWDKEDRRILVFSRYRISEPSLQKYFWWSDLKLFQLILRLHGLISQWWSNFPIEDSNFSQIEKNPIDYWHELPSNLSYLIWIGVRLGIHFQNYYLRKLLQILDRIRLSRLKVNLP